jgi:GH25 family lysozyme M1 (1,4-beta-N-acetylmuramidase)
MTPNEKAKELVEKMSIDWDMCRGQNIQCALIAVDEILKAVDGKYEEYWQQVKQEIEKL